jgi:flagellar hook-associated protein 1
MGTGVKVNAIDRARDSFLDLQYRTELAAQRQAQMGQEGLEEIETVLAEPATSGLGSRLSELFNAWQEVANDPSNGGARATLVQRGAALADSFNQTARQLTTLASHENDLIKAGGAEVNSLAARVASLNRQIVQLEVAGQHANDLRDTRDQLLDQLAGLTGATSAEQADHSVTVTLDGHALVQGMTVDKLTPTVTGPNGGWELRFSSDNAVVNFGSGELLGRAEVRDQTVPAYLAKLIGVASSLITAVNGLHTGGYGLDGLNGRPFFSGTDAATIAIDPAVAADPNKVDAASAAAQAGNGAVALAIAQLRNTLNHRRRRSTVA